MKNLLQQRPGDRHLIIMKHCIKQDHQNFDQTGRLLFEDLIDQPWQNHIAMEGGVDGDPADVDGCS